MARARTPTLMSLDQYAEVVGLNPVHFNQIVCAAFPEEQACRSVWFQYQWQQPGRASREALATAIAQAERRIADKIRFWPAPKYFTDERHRYPVQRVTPTLYNPSMWPYIYAEWKHVQAVGTRCVCETIEHHEFIVYSDEDGDGFNETATISFDDDDAPNWEPTEVAVFAEAGETEERLRIRPVDVEIDGTTVTITASAAQFVDPTAWEDRSYTVADDGTRAIDGDDADNFLETAHIYRIETRSTGEDYAPAELAFESRSSVSSYQSMDAFLKLGDYEAGELAVIPVTWDEDSESWQQACVSLAYAPRYVRINYLAGWATDEQGRVTPPFDRAIAALATSLLTNPVCACGNAERVVEEWQQRPDPDERVSLLRSTCPFGDKRGAWEAWTVVAGQFGF